jgi:branched-chain amino acid transport system ATP-binding protein
MHQGLWVEGLAVDFGYGPVVQDVSFGLARGEVLALVGANGAGKTSTLRAIAGLQRASGRLSVDEINLAPLPAYKRARSGVVLVPEDRGLFPRLAVKDHLWLAARAQRRHKSEAYDYVFDLFPRLREREAQRVGSLSGGEQQMLTIAMAFLMEPSILLLDELSTGLAPILVRPLLKVVADFARQKGVGVILVEQFVSEVLEVADRGIVLARGMVCLEGTASELRARPDELAAAYLGSSEEDG